MHNNVPIAPSTSRVPLFSGIFGGVLMGLANLVPGISGGTMLLVSGVYPHFIRAISEITRFKLRVSALFTIGPILLSAGLTILLLAGPTKELVVSHRWIMYSLFIGLTLGGVPLVWRLARPVSSGLMIGLLFGLIIMTATALFQPDGSSASVSALVWFIGGLAAASAMILPGISGSYLLLLIGLYIPLLDAIDGIKGVVLSRDLALLGDFFKHEGMQIILPVGLGIVVGVAVVSNGLELAIRRFPKVTYGALLGLLLGSIVGLWPYQAGVAPKIGDVLNGQQVTELNIVSFQPQDFRLENYPPAVWQAISAVALIAVGFLITRLIGRIGRRGSADRTGPETRNPS